MTDTPTTNYGLRQQERGTNTSTWGDTLLNVVLQVIDQILGRIKTIAITGDYTITSTNYVTTADNKNRGFKFTGTLTANATITFPTVEASFKVINGTTGGFSLLCKTAAGATVTVPASSTASVYTDGVDCLNAADTYVGARLQGITAGTAATDAVNKTQMETAIAAASGLTAPFILVTSNDTTPGYLGQKLNLAVSGALSGAWSTENSGGDENALLTLAVGAGGYDDGGRKTAPFTAAAGVSYALCSGMTFFLPSAPSDGAKMRLALFNPAAVYGFNPNGKKINNSTSVLYVPGGSTFEITYDSTLGDWE